MLDRSKTTTEEKHSLEPVMRKRFWDNPYQYTLTTQVASVDGNKILLKETIAYAFNGGQEDDKAFINGKPILKLEKDDKNHLIHYTLASNHGLQEGDFVTMSIDWPRRHRLMRLHFAAELVLEIVTKLFNYEKKGAHIGETSARIDFACAVNISTHFDEIQKAYNEIIHANKPIIKDFSDVQSQRRFWKIDGFGQVPCGGTHVNSTSEVGSITLKREKTRSNGQAVERIKFTLCDDSSSEFKNFPKLEEKWKTNRMLSVASFFALDKIEQNAHDKSGKKKIQYGIASLINEYEGDKVAEGFLTLKSK